MSIAYKNPALAFYVENGLKVAPAFDHEQDRVKLQFLRLVSEDFNTQFSREESNEIRGDAQSSGSVITSASGAGSISIQYSLDTYDEMLAGVLFSDYASADSTTWDTGGNPGAGTVATRKRLWGWSQQSTVLDLTTVTAASVQDGSNQIVIACDDPGAPLVAGDLIEISGTGNARIDGMGLVVSSASYSNPDYTITVEVPDADVNLSGATEAATDLHDWIDDGQDDTGIKDLTSGIVVTKKSFIAGSSSDYWVVDDGSTNPGNVLTIGGNNTSLLAVKAGSGVIAIHGSGEQNLNTVWRVQSAAAAAGDEITLTLSNDTGESFVSEYLSDNSGTAISVSDVASDCRNGTREVTYGFIRCYTDTSRVGTASDTGLEDGASDWAQFRGTYLTSLQLSVAPGQAGWTGTFSALFSDELVVEDAKDVLGFNGTAGQDTKPAWNQCLPSNSNPLPDAINGVAQIMIRNRDDSNDDGRRFDALSLNVNVSNNSEEVQALRNRGALCVNQGTLSATVDVEIIYQGSDFHTAMLDDDTFEIEFAIQDTDGRTQLWRLPRCRVTSERPNPGKNAPIVQTLNFVAEAGGTAFGQTAGASGTKMVEVVNFFQTAPIPANAELENAP